MTKQKQGQRTAAPQQQPPPPVEQSGQPVAEPEQVETTRVEADEVAKTALATAPPPRELVTTDNSENACYLDTAKFNQMWRAAKLFADTELVPQQYRKRPADCFVAMQMAFRLNADPMMLMQNTYIVHGRPGMEAKFVIALMNSRGPFTGPVQWTFAGEGRNRSCTAYATHKITGEVCQATVTWDIVEKEGWSKKDGSKWLTMPDMMFQYRSASFLCNLYCPEVKMGMMTVDELIDIVPSEPQGAAAPGIAGLKQALIESKAKSQPVELTDKQKSKAANTTEAPKNPPAKTEPAKPAAPEKPKTYCPNCKKKINLADKNAFSINKSGEAECGDCGYILIEAP